MLNEQYFKVTINGVSRGTIRARNKSHAIKEIIDQSAMDNGIVKEEEIELELSTLYVSDEPMSLHELMTKGNELFKENYSHAKYSMAVEIDGTVDVSEEELEHLIDLGLEIYKESDYATADGVGCAIANHIISRYDEEEGMCLSVILYDELLNAYNNSDWR